MNHHHSDTQQARVMALLIGYALILVGLLALAGVGLMREWHTSAQWATIGALTSAAALAVRHVAVAVRPALH